MPIMLDMEDFFGDLWGWNKSITGMLENNRWYCIEQYLKLNTPGKQDGILKAWIDGKQVYEKSDVRLRNISSIKIESVWMNIYHGGTKKPNREMSLYLDNVVIATRYIGPIRRRLP